MGISVDVLNTTYSDLRGPLQNTFSRSLFLMDILQKRKQKARGGTLIEWPFTTKSPAAGVALRNGTETLDLTRRTGNQKFGVDLCSLAVAIQIPGRDLRRNSGALGVVKLIDDYPKTTIQGIAQDMETFHLTGVSEGRVFATSELDGLMCLNGQYNGTLGGTGTLHGILDFLVPASQTTSTQNIAKSEADGLYNQYGLITSWAADGEEVWRKVYRQCTQFGDKSSPDLMITDDATFGNYQRSKHDLVRVVTIQDNPDKAGANCLMETFMDAKVYTNSSMDLTKFTAPADGGATYFLNSRFWELHILQELKLSPFADMIANQDCVVSKGVFEGQLLCKKYTPNGAVAGGAT